MDRSVRIRELVKALGESAKYRILMSVKEDILRKEIKELLSVMEPTSYVEITHGPEEFGKDLIFIRKDKFGDQVTAVVVVRGEIRTKSAGIIEKIKSQVEQCFTYPAKLAVVKGDLKVAFAWVMIAGPMSKSANTRLVAEIGRPNVQIFDLKWLVDNFTEYHPYVFFDSSVSHYIEDRISELERSHLLHARKEILSDYYVNQKIAMLDKHSVIQLSAGGATFTVYKDVTPFEDMKREMKPPKKFVLVGDPGVGKTTAMAKIAIHILSHSLEKATKGPVEQLLEIPILVRAQDIADSIDHKQLLQKHGPLEEIAARFTVQVLMVDGLDEVPGHIRQEVITTSVKYADALGAALLISTRKIDLVRKEIANLERREILPMEFGQAMTLFRHLTADETTLQALKEGLEKVRGQLPMTPLSLLLLIDIVENNNEVPASAVELYNRFTDLVLGSEDKHRKGIFALFDYKIKKRFLAELAYQEFYMKHRDNITRSDLESFVHQYAKLFDWLPEHLEAFVAEIERAGLLNTKDEVRFAHGSFLHYFAALRIFNSREQISNLTDYITTVYFDEWWSDIAFYYFGMKTEIPQELLESIFRYPGSEIMTLTAKAMAGRLLQAAWHSLPTTMTYGIERAQDHCPQIRQEFLNIIREENPNAPLIYADAYTMVLCEQSFGSRFLWKHSKVLIDRYLANPTQERLCRAIQLTWPMQDRITKDEMQNVIDRLYQAAIDAPKTTDDDAALFTKNLLFLRVLSAQGEDLRKSIEKRVLRQRQLHPAFFARLLPPPSARFRTEEQKKEQRKKKLRRSAKAKH